MTRQTISIVCVQLVSVYVGVFWFGSMCRAAGEDASSPTPSSLPEVERNYVIAGKTYEHSEVIKAFLVAVKNYGFDSNTRLAVPLKELGAVRIAGTPLQQSGFRIIIRTEGGGQAAILLRAGHKVVPGQMKEFSLVKRSATIKKRLEDGSWASMDQYDDVTLMPHDFLNTLNEGIRLHGVTLQPIESRDIRMKHNDRPTSEYDRP